MAMKDITWAASGAPSGIALIAVPTNHGIRAMLLGHLDIAIASWPYFQISVGVLGRRSEFPYQGPQ